MYNGANVPIVKYIIIYSLTIVAITCKTHLAPSIYINHGLGPYPLLGEKYCEYKEIKDGMKNVSNIVKLHELKAIILVSAHREEDIVTVSSGGHPSLVYDYDNVPLESYTFKYNASGNPVLARKIHEAFKKARIPSALDDKKGWDHGVFILMILLNPKADIPIVQISLLKNQNARQHYEMGKVLYQFRKEGIAIFGSGMSYNNRKGFMNATNPEADHVIVNEEFDKFLYNVCTGNEKNQNEILSWDKKPGGLDSHPLGEAEHLMTLIVNIGASGKISGKKVFGSVFKGKFKISGYMWNK